MAVKHAKTARPKKIHAHKLRVHRLAAYPMSKWASAGEKSFAAAEERALKSAQVPIKRHKSFMSRRPKRARLI